MTPVRKSVKELVTKGNKTEVTLTFYYKPISIEEWETTVDLEIYIPAGDDYVTYASALLTAEEALDLARSIIDKVWRRTMTCTIVQKGLGTALCFYHYLRRKGYAHTSAVISVLMYYSPNKEDLYRRLERRHRYLAAQSPMAKEEGTVVSLPTAVKWYTLCQRGPDTEQVYCTCCGHGAVTVVSCPNCGESICQDCTPPFGAHVCEPK